ncbi:MAG: hypothetical protein RL385_3553 [Pseudomonadota bacterium]
MRLNGLFAVVSWTLVSTARAWEGELFCSPPEVQPLESSASLDMTPMCVPGPSHVIRAPWQEDCAPTGGREDTPGETRKVAQHALSRARTLEQEGRFDEALLHYRVLEAELPSLADYARLFQAAALEQVGDPERALTAYRDVVAHSQQSDLMVRAQVGVVRTLILTGDVRAPKELDALLLRFPELPEAADLKLLAAEQREAAGDVRGAAGVYRALDIALPMHPAAARARAHLQRLEAQLHLPALSMDERVARAEHLLRGGDRDAARAEVEALSAEALPRPLQLRVAELDRRLMSRVAVSVSAEEREQLQRAFEAKMRATRLKILRPPQLLALIDQAGRHRSKDAADALLGELMLRLARVPGPERFDALVAVVGVASDERIIALARSMANDPRVNVAARYHAARALERMGKQSEAVDELRAVIVADRSPTRFYANFAEQRIQTLTDAHACNAPGVRTACSAPVIDARIEALEKHAEHDAAMATALLEDLAASYGGTYPWLGRALELARLGETGFAADELYETYLAYRTATRRGPLRSGRASVVKGASTVHHLADIPTLRARALLPPDARASIAEAARLLGDYGTTVVFGGPALAETLPEAYAADVARVAKRFELDPDLLLAVMRVESIYQRRIISHAGAIGLMQIMPRTGRLIGQRLGRYVAATDLLDPHQNVELAGWYLRALLERMNGSLPLAIASYNGGPHNVRRWVEQYGAHLPLDVFLERIPFAETKRYVRRVLGYYARYHGARGEGIDRIAMVLPGDRPEVVAF